MSALGQIPSRLNSRDRIHEQGVEDIKAKTSLDDLPPNSVAVN